MARFNSKELNSTKRFGEEPGIKTLRPSVMRMSEADGLRMLRKFPSLWKALEVRNAASDDPEYWFSFDVFDIPNSEEVSDYD